ncbi:NAD(P)/FAD-dependent oxidoreductase [Flavitalea flava]
MPKKAIIIGAGPAGLTAAYELLKRTDIIPIILEKSGDIGGISKTINYKGNRMDMGPHRFFSKSDRVMDWWLKIMPLETNGKDDVKISYQNKTREVRQSEENAIETGANTPTDKKMLIIQRLTRIYFLRKFFAYPIQLGVDTLKTLGLIRTIRIMVSFILIKIFPRKPEKSLEDFIINKFGRQLYLLFFKDYTEKVWGVPCHEISAEWGAQRIKGVSLSKAIAHAIQNLRPKKKSGIGQKSTETSLIEQFLYPKYGPGSLWEEVARQVEEMGGKVYLNQDVQKIEQADQEIVAITTVNSLTGETGVWEGDYFFSTMPVKELIAGMGEAVPPNVKEIAAGLQYRDFINVGILLKQLSAPSKNSSHYEKLDLKDNWIYIQERDVKVGRLMIYNNWGDGMIKDPSTVWIGMEYFCNKTDAFWDLDDDTIQKLAVAELEKMGLANTNDILDTTVRRMEKTYPAYFGTYDQFDKVREFTDKFRNLFLVGRNGMHKYNNSDHSMLTSMVAVDNIAAAITSKENIWSINTEQEYHEEKTETGKSTPQPVQGKAQRTEPSFIDFIWNNKGNRVWLYLSGIAFIIQFILFKRYYPFANYMPDSYSYLDGAFSNADVNMWPVAYSKFLRLISVFTHSDKVLVGIQYLFMQATAIFFLLTLFYFLRPGKIVQRVLWFFCILNPIPLYVSNYVSADALFFGFSLTWLTVLLWILYRPRPYQLWLQGILLLACFTLRYNAIYYPIIAALVFLLSRQRWERKLAGITLGTALVFVSILYTSQKMQEITGHRQFSAFGGWQMANNALYMYEHIPASERGEVPKRFAKLEGMVRQHMDTLKKVKLTAEDSANSYFYLWSGRSPLSLYLENEWKKDSTTTYFNRWASEAPLYLDYAKWLILKHPWSYIQTFMFPNAIKFAVPPSEFLGMYNMGGDSVGMFAKNWFHYKSQRVKANNKKAGPILFTEWYPVFSALVNLLLLLHVVGLLILGGLKRTKGLPALLGVAITLWLLNTGFSVFASPIVLRYQVFPILVSLCVALLTGEAIYKTDPSKKIIA